jgi:prepilin-type N-terminal cleavage/methylation domain-containing protein
LVDMTARTSRRSGSTLVELPAVSGRKRGAFTLVELPAVSGRNRGAFTLVELLVVVAILALLITLLMPSLQKAKELAKDAMCRQNLRGIALALHLYAEDNDGWLPHVCYSPAATYTRWKPYWETWNNFLARYPENHLGWAPKNDYTPIGMFGCPSYADYEYDGRRWDPEARRGTYGFNMVMSAYENKGYSWTRRDPAYPPTYPEEWVGWNYHLPSTIHPGSMYLVGDTNGPGKGHGHQYSLRYVQPGSGVTMHFRHLEHTNMLYHDQHAGPLEEKDAKWERGYWHQMPWWNREDKR